MIAANSRSGTWLAALLLALVAATAHAEVARYQLDPDHLAIGFLVDHIGYAKTLGLFRKASGSFSYDAASGQLSELKVVIEASSVFTNQDARDGHLRGKDFLDVARFPRLVFTASGARRNGDRDFVIEGQLEMLGQKRPVSLRATLNKSERSPIGPLMLKPWVAGVSARTRIKRSDFGMTYGVVNGWVGDEVEVIIELEAKRQ